MTHFFKISNTDFDKIEGKMKQIMKPKGHIKAGDAIVFECANGKELHQKNTVVTDVDVPAGLMKGYYLVNHELPEEAEVSDEK